MLTTLNPAFEVDSHLEREFVKNIGADHLTVNYPVGNYEGSLGLIEDLFSALVAER